MQKKSNFSNKYWRKEKTRVFDIDNVDIIADIVHYCIKGIEVPYIRGQIAEELMMKPVGLMWRKSYSVLWDAKIPEKNNLINNVK